MAKLTANINSDMENKNQKGSSECRDARCGISISKECGCRCYGKGHGKMIPQTHPAFQSVPKLEELYLYPTHRNPKVVLKKYAKVAEQATA